jgi:hypothetical protein
VFAAATAVAESLAAVVETDLLGTAADDPLLEPAPMEASEESMIWRNS